MAKLTIELAEIMPRHMASCGSKATNLGAIARKSQTAPGFCLTTGAYFQALKQSGLFQEITEMANTVTLDNLSHLEEISGKIQVLIRKIPMPDEVEEALREGYEKVLRARQGIKVAVRSSATAEDLPSASFAGQLESYLNLENWQQVKEAVINCWVSLWSPRVMHYRLQKKLDHDKVGMAVIVQEMVAAQVAGVMFTANPITNSREEIYIEAVAGLAEKLVQGEVAGEIYTINKEQNIISSRNIQGDYPLLTDFALRQLAHEGKKLEYLFEDYQDVEWAFYNGELFILQSRPITTLAEEEWQFHKPKNPTPIQEEIFINIQERFPEPVLPLDAVVAKIYYLSLFAAYAQLGFSVPVVNWRKVEQGVFPDYFTPPAIKPSSRRIFYLGKMLVGNLIQEWHLNEAAFDKYVQLMKQDLVINFPMEIIMEYLEDGFRDFQRANTFRYLLYIQYGNVYKFFRKLLKRLYGSEGEALFEDLVAGQPQVTMEVNRSLEEIARVIRENDQVKEFVLSHSAEEVAGGIKEMEAAGEAYALFEKLVAEHGHREVSQGLGGIGAATWQDRPEVVWGMIKGLVLQPNLNNGEKGEQLQRRAQAELKLARLTGRGWGKLLPVRKIIARLLEYSRQYTAFRENSHSYLTKAMLVFRTLFLAIGQQLVYKGYLKDKRDIMYLTFWEVRDLIQDLYSHRDVSRRQLEETIKQRKTDHEKRKARWANRDLGAPVRTDSDHLLQGIAASRGQVTGPCRVIKNPEELHRLQPGDILVAQSTNPSWTPVFSIIGGLIVEHGSALSHAAIIAREYGIPAVMGVAGATGLLADGIQVTVDGSKGLISTHSKISVLGIE